MIREELIAARDRFIAEHGPWTGHRIHLGQGVYTCEDVPQYCLPYRMALHLQIMADFGFSRLEGLRILDLGCHEGAFTLEFARRGATAVGIDCRKTNIDHANFAKAMIGLPDDPCWAIFRLGDVQHLESLGRFDIILCAGILYHLTAEDAVSVMRQIVGTGAKLVVIDTHIAPSSLSGSQFAQQLGDWTEVCTFNQVYQGRWYSEFPDGLTAEAKLAYSTGSALDNDRSFWFSPADLRRMVKAAGFRVYQAVHEEDRVVLAGRR